MGAALFKHWQCTSCAFVSISFAVFFVVGWWCYAYPCERKWGALSPVQSS